MTPQAPTANRFRELTAVRDGDGYVIGSPRSPDYLAVPEIGGRVVQWLRAGEDLGRCGELAEAAVGQPVDIARFVAVLDDAGLLPADTDVLADADVIVETAGAVSSRPVRGSRIGRFLFGPVGMLAQIALGLAGIGLLVSGPELRPTFEDAFIFAAPLPSMLLLAAIGTALGLLHEVAHVLAAAQYGVRSRMSVSRRLFVIVYQTDLTGLWGLPRRQRAIPIAAGMTSDAAVMGLLLLVEQFLPVDAGPIALAVVRALILLKFTSLLFQIEIFMRTDAYALFALATRSRNLWATKGAVARQLVRRGTPADRELLNSINRREVRWAAVYLVLYVPGVVWATWYLVVFGVPSILRIVHLSVGSIRTDGLPSVAGLGAVLALLLCLGPLAWTVSGVVGNAARVVRNVVRTAPAGSAAGR